MAQGLNKKKDKKFKKSHDIISVYEQTNKIRRKTPSPRLSTQYKTFVTKETRKVGQTDEAFFSNNLIHV